MSQFTAAVAGMVVGFVLVAIASAIQSGWSRRPSLRKMLKRHFQRDDDSTIKVHSKVYPYRVCVDAYRAVAQWIETMCGVDSQVGIAISDRFMRSLGIATFLSSDEWFPAALEYNSFDVGDAEPAQCVRDSLWLGRRENIRFALLWTAYTDRGACGVEPLLRLDVAHIQGADESFVTTFFERVESEVQRSASYRGKVLSLDSDTDYSGNSIGIVVHRLEPVERDHVILPELTLCLLERNLIRFAAQRVELAKLGLPTKKGLLLYGPPGTGKTHTIRYLASALHGHTVLLATAEQMGNIAQYIALARLLQPSIVVIEDVDLTAETANISMPDVNRCSIACSMKWTACAPTRKFYSFSRRTGRNRWKLH